MSINDRRGHDSLDDRRARLEVFDGSGRIDQVATDAANDEIFHEVNTVFVVASAQTGPVSKIVDTVATAALRAKVKAAILARRK